MRVTARQYRDMAGLSGDACRTVPDGSASLEGNHASQSSLSVLISSLNLAGASAPVLSGIVLTLPVPPSLNNAFVNTHRGRVKSAGYKAWLRVASAEAMMQRQRRIAGRYDLAVLLPRSMRGDIDNRIKPISDLMVTLGLIDDDSLADSVMARRSDGVSAGQCIISIHAVSPPPMGVGCGPKPLPLPPHTSPMAGAEAAMV